MEEKVIIAHKFSSHHRSTIEKNKRCGCFFCKEIYHPKEITEWIDNGVTALCPKCGIDAVVPDSEVYSISEEFLKKMNEYWF